MNQKAWGKHGNRSQIKNVVDEYIFLHCNAEFVIRYLTPTFAIGMWTWNINGPGAANTKSNGRRLVPAKGTNTFGRSGFLTHSCLNAFGPSLGPTFCSEGCITGSANSMQQLNQLLDAEPTSTLNVME